MHDPLLRSISWFARACWLHTDVIEAVSAISVQTCRCQTNPGAAQSFSSRPAASYRLDPYLKGSRYCRHIPPETWFKRSSSSLELRQTLGSSVSSYWWHIMTQASEIGNSSQLAIRFPGIREYADIQPCIVKMGKTCRTPRELRGKASPFTTSRINEAWLSTSF